MFLAEWIRWAFHLTPERRPSGPGFSYQNAPHIRIQPELTMSSRPSRLTSMANSLLLSVSGPFVSAPSRKSACFFHSGASYQFRPAAMSKTPSPLKSATEQHSENGPNQ
jgi:hypothetical protein